MAELEDKDRKKFENRFNAEVEKYGGSRLRYDQQAMKDMVIKEFEGYKAPIHRRPAAGESRESKKQDVATEIIGMEISSEANASLNSLLESTKWRFVDVLVTTWLRLEVFEGDVIGVDRHMLVLHIVAPLAEAVHYCKHLLFVC